MYGKESNKKAIPDSKYVISDSSTLAEKMHTRLLLMMKELHRICVENDITYYIAGGTALGARRHKGFIPWDDDVDIMMPRPDYERFSMLHKEIFPDFLELRWYKNTKDSPFQFIKLIDNRTTLIETLYNDYVEGLYIDIFPLDGAREVSLVEKIRRDKIRIIHKMIIIKCSTRKKNTLFKRIAARLIKKLNLEKLHNYLEKQLLMVPYELCSFTGNFLGAWGDREIMEKDIFGTPKLYPFEDAFFYGPEYIDKYLSNVYGDFMSLPPIEERCFRHNYPVLDFDIPFREYEKVKES